MESVAENVSARQGWRSRCQRLLFQAVRLGGRCVAVYFLLVLLGLWPANRGFRPSPSGITVYVVSGPVHADLILPVAAAGEDWRDLFPHQHFAGNVRPASHVAIGWGDQGFYLETPRWKDLRVRTAVKAIFWPSRTCLHVAFSGRPRPGADCRAVTLSEEQYSKLAKFIRRSLPGDPPQLERIDFAYGQFDAFYEARGSYHAFNTCNCWVGRALRAAGVSVPSFSPLPRTVLWYLPEASP